MAIFYLILYLSVIFAAVGQILLKVGTGKKGFRFCSICINSWVVMGLGAMLMSMLLNLRGLSVIPLRDMAFILPTIYVVIPVFSRIFLKEKIGTRTIIGTVILVFGIVLFNIPFMRLY